MGVQSRKTEYRAAFFVLVIVLVIHTTCYGGAAFDLVKGNTSITSFHCNGGQHAEDEECLNIGGDANSLELMDSHSHRGRNLKEPPPGIVMAQFTQDGTNTAPGCPQGTSTTACLELKRCTGIFSCYQ